MSDGSPSEGQPTDPNSSDVINLAALEAACGEEGAQTARYFCRLHAYSFRENGRCAGAARLQSAQSCFAH